MKYELPDSRVLDALQTQDAMEQMQGPRGTSDLSFHTTCVASKAIGSLEPHLDLQRKLY